MYWIAGWVLVRPENEEGPADDAYNDQDPRGGVPPFRLGERPQMVGTRTIADKSVHKRSTSGLNEVVDCH